MRAPGRTITSASRAAPTTTRTLSALARSCHPLPTVAVTTFATVLAVTAGNPAGTCALLAAAVLTGQASIGWSNDRVDSGRDRQAGRADKPVATGELGTGTVERAVAASVLATVGLSLALGWRAGLLHLGAVACGWLYNLWLKRTWWSWLPYVAAFGALPGVATLALPGHPGPAAWVVAAGGLLGLAANLTNSLPDLGEDKASGVRGLPHRLGARPSFLLAAAALAAACGAVVFGPPGAPGPGLLAGLALDLALVVGATGVLLGRLESRLPFYAVAAVAGLDVLLVAVGGHRLH